MLSHWFPLQIYLYINANILVNYLISSAYHLTTNQSTSVITKLIVIS